MVRVSSHRGRNVTPLGGSICTGFTLTLVHAGVPDVQVRGHNLWSPLQWPQSTKFSLLRTSFFSNKWCRGENKWCRKENKWYGEENKWCREENKWCREENKWCREENKWCGEENKWCREENKWCREENKWCREEKMYFGATVHMES